MNTCAVTTAAPSIELFQTRSHRAGAVFLQKLARDRPRRVLVLLAGIVVLSIADLAVTLTHLMTIGMAEANPIARFLMQAWPSPWALGAFKIATLSMCVGLLYWMRRRKVGEAGAWVATFVLVGMCIQWHEYALVIDDPMTVHLAMEGTRGDAWVVWN